MNAQQIRQLPEEELTKLEAELWLKVKEAKETLNTLTNEWAPLNREIEIRRQLSERGVN